MVLSGTQHVLAVLSGGAVGFSLGLIGGGGSILALGASEDRVCASDPRTCTPNQAAAINAMNKPTRTAPRMLIVQTYL
jgi:uncharacterized protein